ncbi:NIF-domain-containing protein [Rhodofomes roseus]|uniref:Mitochondrial import inner membrane translocase subunit TIM50 n=1 Tax=Rhodofomes roseus TaxID=34475 RepID=A0ABQ8K9F6_9APHY|nr:NIF-domain-containing protein [Rhodofomes roseus]KAH9833590.1 NIF-domain-containing protein [Rhodofomes roseus]
MLAAALSRSLVSRRIATHSVRCLASKPPPKQPVRDTPPPPPAPTGPSSPSSSSVPSLDFSPTIEEDEGPRERTGARSSENSLSSIERRRRMLARGALAAFLVGAGVQTWLMGREWEEWELKERRMKIEDAPSTRWGRTKSRFTQMFDFFTEPLWPELLPDPHPSIPQKPYTLLVSIDDLLVTSTWDRQHGWRTAKRPGVDYFIAYLSQFYEVVVFTTQYNYTATPILDKLDPYQFFITYRLYRDACRSVNGQPVKDLSYLNRDLSKVVVLDTHPEHVTPQPENAIIMPKWTGDSKDRGLIAIIPFLESIGIFKPPDVRPILQAYHGKNIPVEYAKKEAEMKQKHIAEWQQSKGLSTNSFTLSSLFGSPSQPQSSPIPPTYLEQKRREAQLQYQEEQAYIRANKENFERMIKEEQEALEREMRGGTLWGSMQSMVVGPPPPQQKDQPAPGPAGVAATAGATTSAQPGTE